MESHRVDNLSRMLASGVSRRTVLRGAFGGALAAVGLAGVAAAEADKVDICHYDADIGTYQRINVSVNAVDAHLAHGDNSGAGCAKGDLFSLDTCECVNQCAGGEFLDHCGLAEDQFAGSCLQSVETGELVCLVPKECSYGAGCKSDADCPDPASEVCRVDTSGFCGSNHCHPLYPYS